MTRQSHCRRVAAESEHTELVGDTVATSRSWLRVRVAPNLLSSANVASPGISERKNDELKVNFLNDCC